MNERILKDQTNRVWMDTSGRILKERPFSSTPLQNGLIGSFFVDPLSMTFNAGYTATWAATNNPSIVLAQSNLTKQPYFDPAGFLVFTNSRQDTLTLPTMSIKSVVLVMSRIPANGTSNYFVGAYNSGDFTSGLGMGGTQNAAGLNYSPYPPFMVNKTYINSGSQSSFTPFPFGQFICLSANYSFSTFNLGRSFASEGSTMRLKAVLIYDRALSMQEQVYNANAMNVMYGLF